MDDKFLESLKEVAKSINDLATQAVREYSKQVNSIIQDNCRDENTIQHLLDHMLDFCFDKKMLLLYRKLCKYYFDINPRSTEFYINSYREMWDNE